jgi:Cupin
VGWGALNDGPPVRLEAGDVVLFPHGDRYIISSTLDPRASEPEEAHRRGAGEGPADVRPAARSAALMISCTLRRWAASAGRLRNTSSA